MKIAVFITFVVLAASAVASLPSNHSIEWGRVQPFDKLLSREILSRPYKFWRIIHEDYEFPPKNQTNFYNITSIRCADQYMDGNGGYATLEKGGPGHKSAIIHLKSKRNHGFNFIIEIFGRY